MIKVDKSRQFSHKKGGTVLLRQEDFLVAYVTGNFNISKACASVKISRACFYKWLKYKRFQEKLDEVIEAKIDAWEEALHRNIIAGAEVSTIFGLKTLGRKRGYGDKPMPSKEAIAIIKKLLADKITTKEAAYKLYMIGEQIPDVMRIELTKQEVEPDDSGVYSATPVEELERRAREAKEAAAAQLETFLPKRREEVAQMKEDLKEADSFAFVEDKDIERQ